MRPKRQKSRYREGSSPLQAGGARLSALEASILYPATVSTTLPGSGPFALPHQLFSAATLYRVASRSYIAPPNMQFLPSLPNEPPPRSIDALAVAPVGCWSKATEQNPEPTGQEGDYRRNAPQRVRCADTGHSLSSKASAGFDPLGTLEQCP